MIDIHAHYLPALDDGAPDMDTALRMLAIAEEEGVTAIAASVHLIPGSHDRPIEEVRAAEAALRERMKAEGFSMALSAVHEIHAGAWVRERVRRKTVIPYDAAGRYILLEMPLGHTPPWIFRLVDSLLEDGVVPVLAHPERSLGVRAAPDVLVELVRKGCLVQVTADSLPEKIEEGARTRFTERLIRHCLVHAVASDAHDDEHRSPRLQKYHDIVEAKFGTKVALALFERNPEAILVGEPVSAPRPVPFSGEEMAELSKSDGVHGIPR